ncbi:MAG: hypothetical protein AB4352_10205 [Hormoscilla sp.]
MKPVKVKQWLAAVTFALGSLTYALTAEARELGGVNLNKYCQNRFNNPRARAVLVQNNAWGWRCQLGQDKVSISMDNACKIQYNNQRAYSRATNPSDPYSWKCFEAN